MSEMPVATRLTQLRERRQRTSAPTAVRPGVLAAAAVVGWSVLLLALTWRTWGDLGRDTGYDLLASARTAHGDLPYVDYVYYYGPLSPLLLGGLYAVFGESVAVAVGLGLVLSAGIIGLSFVIGRRLAGPVAGGLAGGLAATAALGTANNSFVLPHSTSAPLATLLTLGTVLALLDFASARRRARLVLAGILTGLVLITRPEVAAPVGIAMALWALVRVLDGQHGRREALRDAASLLAPAVMVAVVVYGAFLTAISPHDLLFENLYPLGMLKAGGHVILQGQAPLTISSFASAGAKVVLYALIVAGMAAAAHVLARDARTRRLGGIGAGLAIVVAAAMVAARPETVRYYLQFAYAWVPVGAGLATVGLWWHLRRSGTLWSPAGQGPLLVCLVLAGAAASSYGAFYPHARPGGPQTTAYLLPLVALFLVWLHLAVPRAAPLLRTFGAAWIAMIAVGGAGLVVHDARREPETVRGPHGAIAATSAQAGAFQGAIDAIERYTRPGDPILLAPQMTSLYVMTDRTDPLRQLSLLPGALASAADERAAIARLGDVRLAVVDRRKLSLYGHGAFGTTFDRVLAGWLDQNFRRVETVRGTGSGAQVLDVFRRVGA